MPFRKFIKTGIAVTLLFVLGCGKKDSDNKYEKVPEGVHDLDMSGDGEDAEKDAASEPTDKAGVNNKAGENDKASNENGSLANGASGDSSSTPGDYSRIAANTGEPKSGSAASVNSMNSVSSSKPESSANSPASKGESNANDLGPDLLAPAPEDFKKANDKSGDSGSIPL